MKLKQAGSSGSDKCSQLSVMNYDVLPTSNVDKGT